MNTTFEIIIAVLLVAGASFALLGSWGLAKFDDFYMRLHGPTKASTLGLGCLLLASSVFFTVSQSVLSLHEVLITLFLFITAPVSAHMLAKTALLKDFEFVGEQTNPMDHPLNVRTEQLFDLSGQDETQLPDESEAEDDDEDE